MSTHLNPVISIEGEINGEEARKIQVEVVRA